MKNNFVGKWRSPDPYGGGPYEMDIVQDNNMLTIAGAEPRNYQAQAKIESDGIIVLAWTDKLFGAGQTRSKNIEYSPINGKPIRIDWENGTVWSVVSIA